MVIVIERAERLCENLPELVVLPHAWLSWSVGIYLVYLRAEFELLIILFLQARVSVSIIFLTSIRWEDLRPPPGAAPDLYFLGVQPLTKQGAYLCNTM